MRVCLVAVLALAVHAAAFAAPAYGQSQRQSPPPLPRPSPDFLFGRPDGSVGLRGSWLFARAGSDWYDFVTDQLTLEDRDFNAPAIGADVGIALGPRLHAVIGVDFSQAGATSEYRRLVDNNRLPISQRTRVREVNLSGNLKFALSERGRDVSRFAWVPRSVVPYVGAGGGMLWFEVQQTGDFVDFVDLSVFSDVFRSRGWTPSAQVFGGVDIRVYRRLFVTFDGRYLWAAGDLGSDWIDFEPIDLAGFRLAAGINVLF
jgi:hypothetical protein